MRASNTSTRRTASATRRPGSTGRATPSGSRPGPHDRDRHTNTQAADPRVRPLLRGDGMTSTRRSLPAAAALFLSAALAASAFAETVQLNGAGATFPAPIYTKWFSEYHKLHPN